MNVVSFRWRRLDLGFKKAGFNVIWANEYDKEI
jgi:site-specific DNA-cytosine methylase